MIPFGLLTLEHLSRMSWKNGGILRPSSNRSPDILMLVKKVKYSADKVYAFVIKAILCREFASYFI